MMPVHAVKRDGKTVGYQYGTTGKIYSVASLGKAGAAKKAGQQAGAIEHSEKEKGNRTI
jgi:hypothetical protein